MSRSFAKMHGLGNDFVVIHASSDQKVPDNAAIIALADRKRGVGFDQLLWLMPVADDSADFALLIFNADGSQAEQCGNGLRCIARYIDDERLCEREDKRWRIATKGGVCDVWHESGERYGASLCVPILNPEAIPFIADGQAPLYRLASPWGELEVGVVSMGNPHVVLRVDDLSSSDILQQVQFISGHERLPHSANVGVCVVDGSEHITLHVYERGAGWTDACGSGACACVVVAKTNLWLSAESVVVTQPGGDLSVFWSGEQGRVDIVGLTARVFDGTTSML